jgi:pimeloyl-ACP methyl ester carboxylesterase
MQNPRKYGAAPYSVAVIHGGPGAAGEMAPVARMLSKKTGVLEPLQTALSVAGQAEELKLLIEKNSALPVTLVGYSWGAWLSMIFAAQNPLIVKKIILVSSAPFEERYADGIQAFRMKRLSTREIDEIDFLMDALENPIARNKDKIFIRIGELMSKTDAYRPLEDESGKTEINAGIFRSVWREASGMRSNGSLMETVKQVSCPVTAIHGDYDPHPAEGVEKPLSGVLKKFKFILLKNCGHTPWIEKEAREEFFRILSSELLPDAGTHKEREGEGNLPPPPAPKDKDILF